MFEEQEQTGCRQLKLTTDVTKTVRDCQSSQGHVSRDSQTSGFPDAPDE
jgi:hypothetical protein